MVTHNYKSQNKKKDYDAPSLIDDEYDDATSNVFNM